MAARDLHLTVHESEGDRRVDVGLIGIGSDLTEQVVGHVRLDVHEGHLRIEVERRDEASAGPVELLVSDDLG